MKNFFLKKTKHAYVCLILNTLSLCNVKAQTYNCDCEKLFDETTKKLEANYVAYHLTKNQIEQTYIAHKTAFRKKASATKEQNCTALLQEFLSWFKDGHLFVVDYPRFSAQDSAATRDWIKKRKLDVKKIAPAASNTVEGYWTDGSSVFAIIKNTDAAIDHEYLACIVKSADTSRIGEIKLGVNFSQNKYTGTYYTGVYSSRYVELALYKEQSVLSVWGGILWGRLPSKEAELYNPMQTKFSRLNEKTVQLTIPSFLVEAKDFNKVLNDHKKELKGCENLVIDVRGNTGGNGIYFNLLNYYYEKPWAESPGFAISSEDNMAYFERFAGGGKSNPYAAVLSNMKEKKNQLVQGPDFGTFKLKPIRSKLKRIIILTDNGVMSAAETFVLSSKAISSKVIVMGENTGGVVDYSSINMIPLNCPKYGTYFGYPTYSMNSKSHIAGYNKSGIAPDVKIEAKEPDKSGFILRYIEQHP